MANPTFPRTQAPMHATRPQGTGPLLVNTDSGRLQASDSIQVGVRWSERWPPMDHYDPAVLEEIALQAREWARVGQPVQVRPFSWRRARGSVAVGATGAVAGGSQLGSTLVTDGWPAGGTFKRGDYLVVTGVPYALWLLADVTADGSGNATFTVGPGTYKSAYSPADNATITLNGLLQCLLAPMPSVPASFQGTEWYSDLVVHFAEAVRDPLEDVAA